MGTYLSTPVLDKHSEDGSDINDTNTPDVRWAVVDMQGWRKSMEDAHVARTDVTLPSSYLKQTKSSSGENDNGETKEKGGSSSSDDNDATHAKVFAVFDGHGGAEVARFCQIHLVPVLTSQPHWKGENEESNSEGNNAEKTEDNDDSDDVNMASSIGKALVESFHALDRLIDDPNSRSEIERWRLERPPPYAHGETNDVYDNPSILSNGAPAAKEEDGDYEERVALESESDLSTDQLQQRRHTVMDPSEIAEDAAKLHLIDDGGDESDDASEESNTNGVSEEDKKEEEDVSSKDATTLNGTVNTSANLLDAADEDEDEVFEDSLEEHPPTTDDIADELENKCADGVVHDDSDDDEKEEQTNEKNENDDGEVDKASGDEKGTTVLSANDAVSLFQKLLHMNGADEGDDDEDDEDNNDSTGTEENGESDNVEEQPKEAIIPTKEALLNPPTGIVAPSVSVPTRIQNGRKICNLPDHPVHAGCTSVVAVIVGQTLVVANAGDSRAVVCRAGGLTEPLSFDHKPLQNREMNRITNAGGFVNQFGRVNGNLNLSRSIGDLKYKQVPGIHPSEQMITAEPDILSTTLKPGDEFIVLGCDGIWDCLTNEECVKYVHDRIDSKHPLEIGKEMLDEIVSADPRASQGIGGDNMTIMIIDLIPKSRPYSID